jgi:opacity protein-like surface antigen
MARLIMGIVLIAAANLASPAVAFAQSDNDSGWEAGIDLVYQNARTLHFEGGTTANLATDWGFSVYFGYRITPNFDAQFALDWANVDYKANIVTGAGGLAFANGSYQSFTPRLNVQFNVFDEVLTPYVMAGIGYSFIDTNIPTGLPVSGCWYDPWYGYVCGTARSTKNVDGFAFQAGLGGRWDVTDAVSVKLAFERHWVELGSNGGTPYLNQIKLGASYRF